MRRLFLNVIPNNYHYRCSVILIIYYFVYYIIKWFNFSNKSKAENQIIMKKQVVIIGFLIFIFNLSLTEQIKGQAAIVALLFGDQVASEKFNISMEAGGVFAHYANLSDTKRSRMGINFGIGANLKLSENWFFSPQVYFLAARNIRFKT